jgi:energy-coupling factor transport system ATP-binding protein
MIKFSRVSLIYPHSITTVIEDLSFEVSEGEMVLVMGHTGAGKSSLLRLMNGLVPHHTGGILAGEITIDGHSTRTMRPGELAGIVGIVGQNPIDSFVADTVEEEIVFGMESLNYSPDVMRKRVEEVLDQVGLTPLRNRTISTLSGGEQQRVAIAAALVMHPKVLLLDEPTSALDPIAAEEILALLHRLVHDLSVTVLLAEHRLERVIGYVDRILLIEEDGTTTIGAPQEILAKTELVPPIVRLSRELGLDEIGTSTRDVRRRTEELRESLPELSSPEHLTGAVIASVVQKFVRYGEKVALNGVSLDLHAGEITALMGRNGAGKSTLIKSFIESGISCGYVPQEPSDLLYHSSVQAECTQADRDNKVTPGSTLALLHATLPTISAETHPRDLSEGERLALVLSIVLVAQPQVLILDEPTRGLDYDAKSRLTLQLKELARTGTAILMATHDVELVAELADRTVFLADGDVVADGATIDVLLASPAFAPQVAKVMSPRRWLTVHDVMQAMDANQR